MPYPSGPTTAWTAWHLHLGSDSRALQSRVATEVIGPVVAGIGGRPWFFLRYWQAGPHLRLRVGDLDPALDTWTEGELRDRMAVVGRPRDGEEPVDPTTYQSTAGRFAAVEEMAGDPVEALREAGVYRSVYVPEVDRYGGRDLMGESERLFHLSSDLVLGFLSSPSAARPRAAALRATVAAAAATGDGAEQALFYAYGVLAWREHAARLGCSAEQIEKLCSVAGSPAAPDPADHGPFARFHQALADLAARVRRDTPLHPGAVVSSHVHMLHNRLGLGLLEELRTYAWLAHAVPVGDRAGAVRFEGGHR
ncbi:MAG: thiopeptide-type bacteriocin biosynthesis protein [Pseudonocardia sp.]|nr:thiopeptide-type bacteriocin biosynthesis protein [Pseudonocardia sp.]